jgi:hypothetical protein
VRVGHNVGSDHRPVIADAVWVGLRDGDDCLPDVDYGLASQIPGGIASNCTPGGLRLPRTQGLGHASRLQTSFCGRIVLPS